MNFTVNFPLFCRMDMDDTKSLHSQLEVTRKELKNLRSSIHGLRQKHLRDVENLRREIQNVQVAGPKSQNVDPPCGSDSAEPFPEYGFPFRAIATISTIFKVKNGTPRQSGVSPSARGVIKLLPPEK